MAVAWFCGACLAVADTSVTVYTNAAGAGTSYDTRHVYLVGHGEPELDSVYDEAVWQELWGCIPFVEETAALIAYLDDQYIEDWDNDGLTRALEAVLDSSDTVDTDLGIFAQETYMCLFRMLKYQELGAELVVFTPEQVEADMMGTITKLCSFAAGMYLTDVADTSGAKTFKKWKTWYKPQYVTAILEKTQGGTSEEQIAAEVTEQLAHGYAEQHAHMTSCIPAGLDSVYSNKLATMVALLDVFNNDAYPDAVGSLSEYKGAGDEWYGIAYEFAEEIYEEHETTLLEKVFDWVLDEGDGVEKNVGKMYGFMLDMYRQATHAHEHSSLALNHRRFVGEQLTHNSIAIPAETPNGATLVGSYYNLYYLSKLEALLWLGLGRMDVTDVNFDATLSALATVLGMQYELCSDLLASVKELNPFATAEWAQSGKWAEIAMDQKGLTTGYKDARADILAFCSREQGSILHRMGKVRYFHYWNYRRGVQLDGGLTEEQKAAKLADDDDDFLADGYEDEGASHLLTRRFYDSTQFSQLYSTMKDSDYDGLTDGEEVLYFLTNPHAYGAHSGRSWDKDTDGDGVADGVETAISSHPLWRDSDRSMQLGADPGTGNYGETLEEVCDKSDPAPNSAPFLIYDVDGDGLSFAEEARLGADPTAFDADYRVDVSAFVYQYRDGSIYRENLYVDVTPSTTTQELSYAYSGFITSQGNNPEEDEMTYRVICEGYHYRPSIGRGTRDYSLWVYDGTNDMSAPSSHHPDHPALFRIATVTGPHMEAIEVPTITFGTNSLVIPFSNIVDDTKFFYLERVADVDTSAEYNETIDSSRHQPVSELDDLGPAYWWDSQVLRPGITGTFTFVVQTIPADSAIGSNEALSDAIHNTIHVTNDRDGDQIPDFRESGYGLDPDTADATAANVADYEANYIPELERINAFRNGEKIYINVQHSSVTNPQPSIVRTTNLSTFANLVQTGSEITDDEQDELAALEAGVTALPADWTTGASTGSLFVESMSTTLVSISLPISVPTNATAGLYTVYLRTDADLAAYTGMQDRVMTLLFVDVPGAPYTPLIQLRDVDPTDAGDGGGSPYGHEQFDISWEDNDPDDNAQINLYRDTNKVFTDGRTQIASGIDEDSTNTWHWNASGLDGYYFICAEIDDGDDSAIHYWPDPVIVGHPTGTVSDTELSLTNGASLRAGPIGLFGSTTIRLDVPSGADSYTVTLQCNDNTNVEYDVFLGSVDFELGMACVPPRTDDSPPEEWQEPGWRSSDVREVFQSGYDADTRTLTITVSGDVLQTNYWLTIDNITEPEGGDPADYNGNPLVTLHARGDFGDSTVAVPVVCGKGVELDGTNGCLTKDAIARQTSAHTFEMWARFPSFSGACEGIAQHKGTNATDEGWYLHHSTGTVVWGSFVTGELGFIATNACLLATNEWFHLAWTWDSSDTTHRLYVNGTPVDSQNGSATDPGDAPLWIGRFAHGIPPCFGNVIVDEVHYWSTARTATQIWEGMHSGIEDPAGTSGLLAYWKLDHALGATAPDDKGDADLTLSGGAAWTDSTAPVIDRGDGPGGIGATNGATDLALWLRADSGITLTGTSTVVSWADRSGYELTLTAAGSPAYPAENAGVNDQPTVDFDGTDDRLSTDDPMQIFTVSNAPLSIATVFSAEEANGEQILLNHGLARGSNTELGIDTGTRVGSGNFGLHRGNCDGVVAPTGTVDEGTFAIMQTVVLSTGAAGSNVCYFKNGESLTNCVTDDGWLAPSNYPTDAAPIDIGARNDSGRGIFDAWHEGDVAEVVLCRGELGAASRVVLDNYFNARYGITISNDYYSSATYWRDAAGVGTYSNTSHGVAQSDGLVLLHDGVLGDDGEFLFAGHAMATNTTVLFDCPTNVFPRWRRVWRVEKTGSLDDTVRLGFDLTQPGLPSVSTNPAHYCLLQRTTTDGDFSVVSAVSTQVHGTALFFGLSDALLTDAYYTLGMAGDDAPGTCLDFDGADDHVVVGKPVTDDITNITVTSWVRFDDFAGDPALVSRLSDTDGKRFAVTVSAVGQVNVIIGDGTVVTSSTSLLVGQWYHLAVTCSGTNVALYVDGSSAGAGGCTNSMTVAATDRWLIGADRDGGPGVDQCLDGRLDELAVWGLARTVEQIRDGMYATLNGDETGLLAYYRFDAAHGDVLFDVSLESNHGALSNTAAAAWMASTCDLRGPYAPIAGMGRHLEFDGGGEVALGWLDPGTNRLTMELWMRPDALPGDIGETQMSIWDSDSDAFCLYFDNTIEDELVFMVNAGMAQGHVTASEALLSTGEWQHVAGVYDGSNGTVTLYLDGVQVACQTNATLTNAPASQETHFAGPAGMSARFRGRLDDCRLWNVARTGAEVADAMTTPLCGDESGLIGYWNFEEGTGTNTVDRSTNTHHGVFDMGLTNAWCTDGIPLAITNAESADTVLRLGGSDRDNDGIIQPDTVSVRVVSEPAHGKLFQYDEGSTDGSVSAGSLLTDSGGHVIYRGDSGYNGSDSFSYEVTDGTYDSANIETVTVSVTSGDANLDLYGNGVEIANGDVAPRAADHTDFGRLYLLEGGSVTRTFTITNSGATALTLTGTPMVVLSGPASNDFSVSQQPATNTLAVAETTTFQVTFTPTTDAVRRVALTILSSDPDEDPFTATLSGSGWDYVEPGGNTLTFDGSSEYAEVPNSSSLNIGSNAVTLETWVKLAALPGSISGDYAGIFDSVTDCYVLYLDKAAQELRFKATDADDDYERPGIPQSVLSTGQWLHVAGLYDGSAGEAHIYLNGTLQDAHTNASLTANVKTGQAASFGRNGVNSEYYWGGTLDEFRIWNTARSLDDIRDNMHREVLSSASGLVAYYRFDQTNGPTLEDLTSNDNDGTVYNTDTSNWSAASWPCADAITNRSNLRAVWVALTNSHASGRFSIADASVSDDDFAVFGHDSGTDDWQTSDTPATVARRLGRVWKAEVSGTVADDVAVGTGGLSDVGDGSKLRLLTDADGVFTNAAIVSGSFAAPTFTATGQTVVDGRYYTLGLLGDPPTVTTATAVTNIGATSAVSGGDVTSDGGLTVTARGVCWNTTGSPTTDDSKTENGTGTGAFTSSLSGLSTATTYHVRAYASNAGGTAYGAERVFTTTGLTPPGNALDFEQSSNQYASIPLTLPDTGTIELWLRPESFYDDNTIFDNSADSNDWEMWIYDSGELRFRIEDGDLRYDLDNLGGSNHWYHATVTWERHDTTLVDYDLWVNGVQRGALTDQTWVAPGGTVYLAGGNAGNTSGDGKADELRFWSDVRTEAEILDGMHHQLDGDEDGLLAWFPCNQSGTAVLDDVSTNNYDGTLTNGPAWVTADFPCAAVVTNRSNLRGAWSSLTNSLSSSLLTVSNAVASGTNWVVFGHDAGNTNRNTTDKPTDADWRLNRAWQFEETGNVTGDVVIVTTGLEDIGDGSQLRLFVDADGVFTNASMVSGSFSDPVFMVSTQGLQDAYYYTLGKETEATLVVLYGFEVGVASNRVVVRWMTASETRTLGFRLYRRMDDGSWLSVGQFVPARGYPNGGIGATYVVVDPDAVPGETYTYKLVELETDGGTEEYGLFERRAYVLKITAPFAVTDAGVVLRWLSRSNESYRITRATNLSRSAFDIRQSAIPATPPENVYTDALDKAGPVFYRIEVDE